MLVFTVVDDGFWNAQVLRTAPAGLGWWTAAGLLVAFPLGWWAAAAGFRHQRRRPWRDQVTPLAVGLVGLLLLTSCAMPAVATMYRTGPPWSSVDSLWISYDRPDRPAALAAALVLLWLAGRLRWRPRNRVTLAVTVVLASLLPLTTGFEFLVN